VNHQEPQDKVWLIYPPQWTSAAPPASMSLLAGFLTANDIDTEVLDLNIGLYDTVLSRSVQNRAVEIIEQEWALAQTGAPSRERFQELARVIPFAREVADRIEKCKQELRSPQTAGDRVAMLRDIAFIDYALRVFSVAYPEQRLSGHTLEFHFEIQGNFDDCIACAASLKGTFVDNYFTEQLNAIASNAPVLVGISINSPLQLVTGLRIVMILRELGHDGLVVFGGSLLPSLAPDIKDLAPLLRHVDAIVYFEGEKALLDLYRHCRGEVPLRDCSNTVSSSEGTIVHGRWETPHLPNKDAHSFSHLPLDRYLNPGPVLSVMPTRSCMYRCAFCAYNLHMPGKWLEADPEEFASDVIELCRRHSSRLVYFSCSMITARWAERFARALNEQKASICWSTQTRVDPEYSREVCRTLYESGCLAIDMGVESLSPSVLKAMRKPVIAEQVPVVVENFFSAGVLPFLFIMRGFPGETVNDWEYTLRGLQAMLPMLLGIHFSNYTLVRGSPAFENPDVYGIEIADHPQPLIGPIDATWKSQAYGNQKEELLHEFMNSLPDGFVANGPDVYRAGLPTQITHCSTYLHHQRIGKTKTKAKHPDEKDFIVRCIQSPQNNLDEINLLNLRTGKHFRFPPKAEPLIRLAIRKSQPSSADLSKDLKLLVNKVAKVINDP
jgi:hypothetical protein